MKFTYWSMSGPLIFKDCQMFIVNPEMMPDTENLDHNKEFEFLPNIRLSMPNDEY